MSVAGIIAEFNPLHNGHIAHINETRALSGCKFVVAVMSGNFVQRGEPAICNKWHRTRMALLNGIDVVVEIPMPYVISGADYFARASVGLLEKMGVVDVLSFGSECGNLQEILTAGEILATETAQYKQTLRIALDAGMSFAAAKSKALEKSWLGATAPSDGLLTKPNNSLAIEYCKALKLLGSTMKIITTHRRTGGPSATKTRHQLLQLQAEDTSQNYPENVSVILNEIRKFTKLDDFSNIFKYLLFTKFENLRMGEGLENRFLKKCGEYTEISDMLAIIKTKRYTYTRLQRHVLKTLLDVTTEDMTTYDKNGAAQYIRILGFKKNASGLVGDIVRKSTLPVITTNAELGDILNNKSGQMTLAAKMLKSELTASDIYRVASGENGMPHGERGAQIVIL